MNDRMQKIRDFVVADIKMYFYPLTWLFRMMQRLATMLIAWVTAGRK